MAYIMTDMAISCDDRCDDRCDVLSDVAWT